MAFIVLLYNNGWSPKKRWGFSSRATALEYLYHCWKSHLEDPEDGESVRGDPLDGHVTVLVGGVACYDYVMIEVTDVDLLRRMPFREAGFFGRKRHLP